MREHYQFSGVVAQTLEISPHKIGEGLFQKTLSLIAACQLVLKHPNHKALPHKLSKSEIKTLKEYLSVLVSVEDKKFYGCTFNGITGSLVKIEPGHNPARLKYSDTKLDKFTQIMQERKKWIEEYASILLEQSIVFEVVAKNDVEYWLG